MCNSHSISKQFESDSLTVFYGEFIQELFSKIVGVSVTCLKYDIRLKMVSRCLRAQSANII